MLNIDNAKEITFKEYEELDLGIKGTFEGQTVPDENNLYYVLYSLNNINYKIRCKR